LVIYWGLNFISSRIRVEVLGEEKKTELARSGRKGEGTPKSALTLQEGGKKH